MKKYIILLFMSLLFVGCSSKSANEGILSQSEPVFIETKATNKRTYINFTNTSSIDSNLTQVLISNLSKNGYEIVSDEKLASIIIKGNLNYFRKNSIQKNSSPSFGFGIGRGWSGVGVGVGARSDNLFSGYIYDAQLSLLMKIKNNKEVKNYTTLLDYQSGDDAHSLNNAIDEFNQKISVQILRYLSE